MQYCNWQSFYGTTTIVWTIAPITIKITLLQLLTFNCTMPIDNFLCTIAIDYFFMHYCNWQLLYGLLQLRTLHAAEQHQQYPLLREIRGEGKAWFKDLPNLTNTEGLLWKFGTNCGRKQQNEWMMICWRVVRWSTTWSIDKISCNRRWREVVTCEGNPLDLKHVK